MYLPERFRESRIDVLQAFVERHPFGALITVAADGTADANHVPMIWTRGAEGHPGSLHGHVARANPVWHSVAAGTNVLAIFSGADAYVSPTDYPGHADHGRVVPTWNYAVVHARGAITFFDERTRAHAHVCEATDHFEAHRTTRWRVADAPSDYVATLSGRMIPFEIRLVEVVGKFKSGQSLNARDSAGLRTALEERGVPASALDELVRPPA